MKGFLKKSLWLTDRNRSGVSTLLHRRAKKLSGKYSWFADKSRDEDKKTSLESQEKPRVHKRTSSPPGEKRIYETVMFIPLTRNASLKKRLTAMEEGLNQPTKVRYVEDMGTTVGDTIVCKNPWSSQGCGRPNCLPCGTKKGRCMRQGIICTLECLECKEGGQKVQYIGESARTGWDRGRIHADFVT